jgi:DNA-binding NarL/FixJ family response regulator
MRVVIVDDDERFRATARTSLESEDVEVLAELSRGRDALDAVRRCAPDVVLVDIGLPDLDGLDVARQLRAQAPDVAVVLISTRDVEYGRRVATGIAAGYLPKDELHRADIIRLLEQVET